MICDSEELESRLGAKRIESLLAYSKWMIVRLWSYGVCDCADCTCARDRSQSRSHTEWIVLTFLVPSRLVNLAIGVLMVLGGELTYIHVVAAVVLTCIQELANSFPLACKYLLATRSLNMECDDAY